MPIDKVYKVVYYIDMIARCNNTNCQSKFETPELPHTTFNGSRAARITEFATCPVCGRMDTHWIYASDVMPKFEIEIPTYIPEPYRQQYVADKIRKLENKWLEAN